MENELLCPVCEFEFNEEANVALMLPSCGHSICRQCLTTMLEQGSIVCAEDSLPCSISDIRQCPVNQTIMKIVKRNQRPSQRLSGELRNSRTAEEDENSPAKQEAAQQLDSSLYTCKEHGRKIEIMCLDDYHELCTLCALYGPHKHHNFKPIEDVVEEVNSRVNLMLDVFGQLTSKLTRFEDHHIEASVHQQFLKCMAAINKQVEDAFKELFDLLRQRQKKFTDEIAQHCQHFEEYFLHKQRSAFKQVVEKAELWKLSAQENLMHFSRKTEAGQISVELLTSQSDMPKIGEQLLEQVDERLVQFERALADVPVNLITLQINKKEFMQKFELCCTIQTATMRDAVPYRAGNSFIEEPSMLLKDVSFAEYDVSNSKTVLPTEFDEEPLQAHKTQLQLLLKKDSNTVSTQGGQSTPSRSPRGGQWRQDDEPKQTQQSKSPSRVKPNGKKVKLTRLPEKAESFLALIKADQLEFVDLSQLDLGDEGLNLILETLKGSKKLRVLKLMRNKISDEGANRLFDVLPQTLYNAI